MKWLSIPLLLLILILVCGRAQAIQVGPGVVFVTADTEYRFTTTFTFATINVDSSFLTLGVAGLQFAPLGSSMQVSLIAVNPATQAGTALAWFSTVADAGTIAFFNVTGLIAHATYRFTVNGATVNELDADSNGAVHVSYLMASTDTFEFAFEVSSLNGPSPLPDNAVLILGVFFALFILLALGAFLVKYREGGGL